MKKIIISSALILLAGYLLKEMNLTINIKDTYFIISYFGLSVLIVFGMIIFRIISFALKQIKN